MNLLAGPTGEHWKKIGINRHHGIDLPLSALHSEWSSGIGEFLDLIPMIDWVAECGMDLIQLLPLNDSGYDPSPYNATSSCALNPLYLSLHSLPYLEEYPELQETLIPLRELNKNRRVDYPTVHNKKMAWLRNYFEKMGAAFVKSQPFLDFVGQNPWVEAYALFMTLKEIFKLESWLNWPKEFKKPGEKEYALLVKEHWDQLCFYVLLQFLAYNQLKKVKEHAEKRGVFLKGDIPILISRDSADVWKEDTLFDLSFSAGSPPDMYIQEGQNWGFPLFNWEEMQRKHYSWWKQRLQWASHFFHLFRIDHVVGFFRIWAIPHGLPPKEGHFIPPFPSSWKENGERHLRMMINATSILPIAEDLGTVPEVTRTTLLKLGICGTKVMRWERLWNEDARFIPYQDYPVISMTTVSTHDSETLAQWWKNSTSEAQDYAKFKKWEYHPELSREKRHEILWESHQTPSLFHINLLQEYLAYFPQLVSTNIDEERINIPGRILSTNWTYRFRPSVEEITSHQELTRFMKALHVS
jgi:4-alpha-glucanotransferase